MHQINKQLHSHLLVCMLMHVHSFHEVNQFYPLQSRIVNNKTEPNGRAMSKAMEMFNGQGRGAELSSAKDTAYDLLCSITQFVDHERHAKSRDHRLNSV